MGIFFGKRKRLLTEPFLLSWKILEMLVTGDRPPGNHRLLKNHPRGERNRRKSHPRNRGRSCYLPNRILR